MNDSEILIIGANGQLGSALRARYPKAKAVDSSELNIASEEQVNNFDFSGVECLINAAAYTNVDGAETREGRATAWQVNSLGVANLVRIALKRDLLLLHISTDYVFDGQKQSHDETESFSPLGVYGQTKAAADLLISLMPKHYIIRTSWVIGEGHNFVRTMLGLGQKVNSVEVVDDQTGRLTFTKELVRVIEHLLKSKPAYGTYNATNGGQSASWADISRSVFKLAGFDVKVNGITTVSYNANKPESAKRPLNSTLDLAKIEATGYHPTDWQTDLEIYVKKELKR